jgi:hypothetical protein
VLKVSAVDAAGNRQATATVRRFKVLASRRHHRFSRRASTPVRAPRRATENLAQTDSVRGLLALFL